MRRMRTLALGGALCALGLFLAARDAEARPPRRHGPLADPGCAHECRTGARECLGAAHDDAKACADSTCPEEVAALREACDADRDSDACKAARDALKACAEPCHDAFGEARASCREESRACLDACPKIEVRGKDRECVKGCFEELRECGAPGHDAFKECREGCADLKSAAREACAEDPRSEECQAAREALHECFDGCATAFDEAISPCFEAARTCVDACPDESAE